MKTGFSFKNIHSSKFGITAATKSRPILPEIKRLTFEPDAYDGVIDLSDCNELGRAIYNERTFSISISVKADNIFRLQDKMTKLASWLSGSGKLIFDDIPAVIWDARVVAAVDYMPERTGQRAVLSVNFNVQPFSYADIDAAKGIPLSQKIPLGTTIPIGFNEKMSVTLTDSEAELDVLNIGTAPVKPRITFEWEAAASPSTNFSVSCAGKSLVFWVGTYVTEYVVDMENGRLTHNGETALLRSGEFFELAPGNNKVVISAVEGVKVTVSYTPRFLYSWETGGDTD